MAEEDILRMFYSYVPTDKQINIIDCGAQSGLYSLYAKYLPNATFYSFEPFITTFQLLNDNICINDIKNVNTYNIGLSDRIGSCILNTCVSHNGLHTIGNNVRRFDDIKPVEIQVNTIDNLFYDKNIQVDFITPSHIENAHISNKNDINIIYIIFIMNVAPPPIYRVI
jgi:FkbM family methyltransferase